MTVALAAFLRPFVALIFFVLLVYPLTLLIRKIIPEGRVKRALFNPRFGVYFAYVWWTLLGMFLFITIVGEINQSFKLW